MKKLKKKTELLTDLD